MNGLTQLLAQSDTETKKCSRCNKVKSTRDFNKDVTHRYNVTAFCRICARKNHHKRRRTERGYIIDTIKDICDQPLKKNKNKKKWIPEISKRGIWQIILNHVCRMKKKFPGNNGRICFYCHKPWTYRQRETDGSRKHGPRILTNFSLDRFNTTITYKNGNIICCCFGCNHRKGSSTPKDWRVFIRAENEME
jgi:hypothetical protein